MSLQLEQLLISDQENYFDQIAGRPRAAATRNVAVSCKGPKTRRVANRMAAIKAKWVAQAIKDADLVSQRETQLTNSKIS